MTACPDNSQWVLYATGDLPAERRRALETHLAGCEACRREHGAIAAGWKVLGLLDPAPPVRPQAMESLRRRLAVAAAHKVARPTVLTLVYRYRWAAAAAVLVAAALVWGLLPSDAPPQHRWTDDNHVVEEIAEITAGLELLEIGDYAWAQRNGASKSDENDVNDEIDRLLKELAAEMGIQG